MTILSILILHKYYSNLIVVVLLLLIRFFWFGFLAVVGVLGIFKQPSDETISFSFRTVNRCNFFIRSSFSSSF